MVKSFYIDKKSVFNRLREFCGMNKIECQWYTNDRIDGYVSWWVYVYCNSSNEYAMLKQSVCGIEG